MGDLKWFVQDNSQQNVGVSTAEALAVVLRPPLWPGAVQWGEAILRHKSGVKLLYGSLAPCFKVYSEFN